MDVQPTPDQNALIHEAIASGRLHRPEEALKEALLLWEQRERRNARLRAGTQRGIDAANRGDFVEEEEADARIEQMLQA